MTMTAERSVTSCPGCGAPLPQHQLSFVGDSRFNLWAREGYCSYRCFRAHAPAELIARHEHDETVRLEREQHEGTVRAPRPTAGEALAAAAIVARPPLAGTFARVVARSLDISLAWTAVAAALGWWMPRPSDAAADATDRWSGVWGFFFDGHPFVEGPGRAALGILCGTLVYFAVCQWLTGATLFKALVGLRVVTERGRKCSFPRILLREALFFLDAVLVGLVAFACMSMTDNRQRLGDMIARTIVVREGSWSGARPRGRWIFVALGVSVAAIAVWAGLMSLLWL
jgi:uncharacterized RDD family membrane protein YckC